MKVREIGQYGLVSLIKVGKVMPIALYRLPMLNAVNWAI
jgi:hypothetical protein